MEILLRCDNIHQSVGLAVVPPSLVSRADVSSKIERCAIPLLDESFTQLLIELCQIYNCGALRIFGQTRVLDFLDRLRHRLLRDLRFSRINVKLDIQSGVGLLVLLNGKFTESFPCSNGSRFALD